MKGFKAFTKDMKCQGFQYEENTEYSHQGEIKICIEGFHFCENPLDMLNYYDLTDCEFAEVEATGEIQKDDVDTKCVTNKIKIIRKLSLEEFIRASFNFLWLSYKTQLAASGNSSKLAASGAYSKLAASGDSSQLAASGDFSQLALNGANSVGAAIAPNCQIRGKKGCWITLAEWKDYEPICVKSVQIDGDVIKEDVWYKLIKGKFEEV